MKTFEIVVSIILSSLLLSSNAKSEVLFVSSQSEFNVAHDNASANDSIVWRTGTYTSIRMDIDRSDLTVMAEELGSVIFTGVSRANILGNNIVFQGFQYLGGTIGTLDVINITGSHITFTQINIKDYTCFKYLRVREESQYVTISYCNFENRLNLDDQNILSILVDDTNPGFHKIQYCSFKNFEGTGNDLGIEPIRIGVSTQADFISRSLVEYCYFTQCDGDGEIISSKASENVYRYNTFENNPKSELVLRHGSDAIVYGNFFINGKGGVRVREGQNHYIYNNYFYQLDDRAIYLQNDPSDPLDNINVAFNTIVDCAQVRLGGSGNNPPTNVTFSNNIFTDPVNDIFQNATETETWIGNISFGDLGITLPTSGMVMTDPELEENSVGYFGIAASSPAINAAQVGYAFLPEYTDIENIDSEIIFDLMKQARPEAIEEKDLGSNEHPHNVLISPFATEENTGPTYDTSTTISSIFNTTVVNDLIEISPNPASDKVNFELNIKNKGELKIDIMNVEGKVVDSIYKEVIFPGNLTISKNIKDLPTGLYSVLASNRKQEGGSQRIQTIKLIKVQ